MVIPLLTPDYHLHPYFTLVTPLLHSALVTHILHAYFDYIVTCTLITYFHSF